jgi:hypothetical protein
VQVNGVAVVVESAIYNGGENTVSLQLAPATLTFGDEVIVSWEGLVDDRGLALSDGLIKLTAQ